MTKEEMTSLVVDENLREKLVNKSIKDFPKDRDKAEDWAQRTLIAGFRKAHEFNDALGAMAYLMEKITFVALEEREREIARRQVLQGQPKYKQHRDPMRHVDYKIDLENAVRRTTREQVLQAALWEIHYERATWDDVLNDMPKAKNYKAWEKALQRANTELRKEMKRKGYRRN